MSIVVCVDYASGWWLDCVLRRNIVSNMGFKNRSAIMLETYRKKFKGSIFLCFSLAICILHSTAVWSQDLESLDTDQLVMALRINDSSRAVLNELKLRANDGDAMAIYRVGDAYRTGFGTPSDLEQARRWYLRAAEEGGLAWAKAAVGEMTQQLANTSDEGVATALPFWRESAEAGATLGLFRTAEYDPRFFARLVQSGLSNKGYDIGPVDGIIGPSTIKGLFLYIEQKDLMSDCNNDDWITMACLSALSRNGLFRSSQ